MKKLLLASAVAALSITAANAAPQVYGKAFLTLDLNDGDTDTITRVDGVSTTTSASEEGRSQLNSISSRIGFKGSEGLTANTDLVYQLEYGIDVDANDNGRDQFYARDTYLGLANKQYGTLVAGRLTAIDDYINYANVTKGGVLGGDSVLTSFDGERANNAFAYFSPERDGLQFMGMYALDENNDSDSFDGDAYGVGVKYEPTNAPYQLGATYIKASQAGYTKVNDTFIDDVRGSNAQFIRLSGAYAVSPALTLGALYQNSDWNTDDNENAVAISGKYNIAQTPWTTYAQIDWVDNVGGSKDAEAQRLVIGGEYAFNKATTGHIYGAYLKTEGYDSYTDGNNYVKSEFDGIGIGGGLEYKF